MTHHSMLPYVILPAMAAMLAIAAYVLLSKARQPLDGLWQRYVSEIDDQLKLLMLPRIGTRIVFAQITLIVMATAVALYSERLEPIAFAGIAALGPRLWFVKLKNQRREQIERQLDGWLQALANALKASSSLGDAIASTQRLIHKPLSDEVELLLKEHHLGAPLDVAVRSTAERIGSRTVSGAFAALVIARQTGGDLADTLRQTAASLREMARLEGVLRSATAQGRSQAYVLGAVPPLLVVAVHWIDPYLLTPLFESLTGNLVLAVAVGLWLGSVIVARRVLSVDL